MEACLHGGTLGARNERDSASFFMRDAVAFSFAFGWFPLPLPYREAKRLRFTLRQRLAD
jgi:hypothetical protein